MCETRTANWLYGMHADCSPFCSRLLIITFNTHEQMKRGLNLEIIEIPIIDYLQTCKKIAYERGFFWIMLFLARERDAVRSYQDLRDFWSSFDDLTGRKILFLLSVVNNSTSCLPRDNTSWRKVYNPHLQILNRDMSDFPYSPQRKAIAIENNTHYITELCNGLDISEDNVPAIALIRTEPFKHDDPIVLPYLRTKKKPK